MDIGNTLGWLQEHFPELTSLQHLGRGGQKLVFSGHHPTDGEIVLKLFHLGSEPERVIREVKAAQEIPSTRIPHIFETGTTNGSTGEIIWMREQRILGKSLKEVLSTNQDPLQSQSILRLALHMLEALAAAEQVRIVHRDVKPDNIIVSNDGTYWLIDFGFARHLDLTSLTATGYGVGTVGYAPPEQFRNLKSEIDSRTDLFALGVTLYECTESVNPFTEKARDVGDILRRVETMSLPRLSRQVGSSALFTDLVLAMTRKQTDHRPSSAAEALEWIHEICATEGVS